MTRWPSPEGMATNVHAAPSAAIRDRACVPAKGPNPRVITPADLCSAARRPSSSTYHSQSRSGPHRRRKRRRFSTNPTGVLQNHLLPATSPSKPVFPTPPSPSPPFPVPPLPQRRTDEDTDPVISERLRRKMTTSSSTTAHGSCPTGQVCTYEDWLDIKELFAKAAEQYNGKHVPDIFKPLSLHN